MGKLNISFPQTGCQKVFEVDDEQKLKHFYDKRMAQEITADHLGAEWAGYVFRISGGNDKQGFTMKQGVGTVGRVKLLLSKGQKCYRPRRLGPKRANNIRKLFALDKSDPVTSYVVRRTIEKEGKKTKSVAPRIQRLVTPVTLQRKRQRIADKRRRYEAAQKAEAEYRKLLNQRAKDAKEKKKERRRSSLSKSKTSVVYVG